MLETQVGILLALDEKAAHLLCFNLLVSGLVVTAASILARDGSLVAVVPRLVLAGLSAGFGALVVSTVFTILAHRAESFSIGLRSEGLVEAVGYEVDEATILVEAVRSYHRGISENRRVRDRAVRHLRWASWSLLVSIICLALGSIGLSPWRPPW